jgi:hypothetical protein
MTLLYDICRGITETIRETLPGDEHELRVFTGAFCVTVLVQLVVFTIMTLGAAWGTR